MRVRVLAVAFVLLCLVRCHGQRSAPYSTSGGSLALSTDDSLLYVADSDNDFVAVVDTQSQAKIAEVKVGRGPERVAVGADDSVWVTNRGSRSVSLIQRGSWQEAARIPVGVEPVGLAISADNKTVYVVNSTSLENADYGTLSAIDARSAQVSWTLPVGPEPRGISLLSDEKAVVTLWKKGDVALVDLARRQVIRSGTDLYERANTARLQGSSASAPRPNLLFSSFAPRSANDVVASPDSDRVYTGVIWSREDKIGIAPNALGAYYGDGGPCNTGAIATAGLVTYNIERFGSLTDDLTDCSVRSSLVERDFPATAITTASVGQPVQGPEVLAIDPTGAWLYMVNRHSNNVVVVSTRSRPGGGFNYSGSPIRSLVNVGSGPNGIALSRDGTKAYVYNAFDHTVSTLTTRGKGENGTLVANDRPLIKVADDPLTDTLTPDFYTGRRMFYSANDSRMNNIAVGVACATCHPGAHDDGHTWGFPDGRRQTPSLAGRQVLKTAPYHWDGFFATLQDFMEHTVKLRMGGTGADPALVRQVATYIDKLTPLDNPHATDVPTDAQRRGAEVFQMAQCNTCHSGELFTNNGFADVGTRVSTGPNPDNLEKLTRGFNVPSLLSIARSAPYLHDGSALTLRDRLMRNKESNQHGVTAPLTEAQIDDLVEYLKSL